MDIVPLLATAVLTATLVTLILGVLSYLAFRARERRKPAPAAAAAAGKRFFVRYVLSDDDAGPTGPARGVE